MKIIYFKTSSGREPVKEYINGLQQNDVEIITKHLSSIQKYGHHASDVIFRKIKGKLWEIKTGVGIQQRIFYVIALDDTMILLHACKKQKTGSQPDDVDLASKRMKEVLS